MANKRIRVKGFKGRAKQGINPDMLALVLELSYLQEKAELVGRNSSWGTWTFRLRADLGEGEQDYFIKYLNKSERYQVALRKMFSRKGLRKPWRYPKQMLKFFFTGSLAKTGFETARKLLEKGVLTAEPVAYLSRGRFVFQREVLLTRKIPNVLGENLAEYLRELKEKDQARFIQEKRRLIFALANLIARLRELDFFLPDLRITNILVEKPGEENFRLWVIDLVEARREKPKEEKLLYHLIADPRRARLFTGTDKIRFLKHYLSFSGQDKSWVELCQKVQPILENWWRKWYERYSQAHKKS